MAWGMIGAVGELLREGGIEDFESLCWWCS